MEAENRRIMEFASQRQQMEEVKMEKIREREAAKENLYKTVETPSKKQNTLWLRQWQSDSLRYPFLALEEAPRGKAAARGDGAGV